MKREMRRKRQLLSEERNMEILDRGTSGVLALQGDEGYPYAVPVSYVYKDGKIYIHGAKAGYKMDCISRNPKASLCVIDLDQVVPEKFTTYFRSVIAKGTCRILEDDIEIREAVRLIGEKYSQGIQGLEQEIDQAWKHLAVIEFIVEELTGKEAIELVRERK